MMRVRILIAATTAAIALAPMTASAADDDSTSSQPPPQVNASTSKNEVRAEVRLRDADIAHQIGWSIGGLAGAGINNAAVSFGFGAGARIGYTFPSRLYLGASGVYHIGESATDPVTGFTTGNNVWYLGPEVGYVITAGPTVIRPYGTVGLAMERSSTSGPGIDVANTTTRPYVAPGTSVLIPLGKAFVGVDGRFMIGKDMSSLGIFGTAGTRL